MKTSKHTTKGKAPTPKKKAGQQPLGRPRSYSKEIGAYILTELMKGRTLTRICRESGVPALPTVYSWLNPQSKYYEEDFSKSYSHAREIQADTLADEIIDISDDGENDTYLKVNKDGKTETCVDTDVIQRSRLRVEARRWRAAHLLPRKYSERMQVTGAEDAPLVPAVQRIVVEYVRPKPRTEETE